jgi:hypothetical protein
MHRTALLTLRATPARPYRIRYRCGETTGESRLGTVRVPLKVYCAGDEWDAIGFADQPICELSWSRQTIKADR